jgi:hypothetical protein
MWAFLKSSKAFRKLFLSPLKAYKNYSFHRKNRNGTACVLKSLCETSQKNQNDEKGSFLTEILRAVFSLPDQIHPHKKDNHRHYDEAHQKLDHDCSILYPDCEESFWSPDFVF